jgi:hypothetical protein
VQITIEEYSTRKNHILQRLEQVENQDFKTKASLVRELIEITAPTLDSGAISGLKREDTAKFLWKEFDKHNVTIGYRWFIDLFPEDLKRKYSKSEGSSHLAHDFVKIAELPDGTIVSRCECGKKAFDGVPVTVQEAPPTPEDKPSTPSTYKPEEPQETPKSVIIDSLETATFFVKQYAKLLDEFGDKCKDPEILKDLEATMEYTDLAKMFVSLENLYTIPTLAHEDGPASIMDQMKAESNFRAPATPLQLGMCYLLQMLTTFRQWAHKLSVSPRQHQRIRERLDEWPEKKAEKIIENVIGSHTCPVCDFNLVSKKGNPRIKVINQTPKPQKVYYGDKWYMIPKEYEGLGMNPIEIAYEVFRGKFKLRK